MAEASSWTLPRPDGLELGVHAMGSGPDVVLVHGTACDHRVWARVARRLAANSTVHAVDRRGRGASAEAPAWRLVDDVEDLAALAAQLEGAVPVVGHSLGGIVALEAAAGSGQLGPVCVYEPPIVGEAGPGVEAADELARILETQGPAAIVEAFLREVGYTDDQLDRLRTNEEIWEATLATAPTIPPETRAVLGYEIDADRMGQMEEPVLLLAGEDSPPDFEPALQRLAKVIPDARRDRIAAATHAVLNEAPGAFAKRVQAFLDEHA